MPKSRDDSSKPVTFLKRLKDRVSRHHDSIYAGAIAFFAFVALIPALAAIVSITSLVAPTDRLVEEAEAAMEAAPEETRRFIVNQLERIADSDDAGVGAAAVVSVLLSAFSASGAIGNLMTSLNRVFERVENRNFVRKRLIALLLLLSAIVLVAAMVATMAVLPEFLTEWIDNDAVRALVDVGRFVGLGLFLAFGLTALYRIGPANAADQTYALVPGGRRPIISVGSLVGTVLFLILSWGFGVFVRNFGSYNETYGTLAGIVVVLLWLQLVSLAILIGAEVDALRGRMRIETARTKAGLPLQSDGG